MSAKRARSNKAWSGRMAEATHPLVEAFTTSYPIDCRLYPYDIAGSIAHARMLGKQRIIPARDAARIVGGLGKIRREFERGAFKPKPHDEDVHMAIERRLIELIGPVGGKLHTARSRNDQIALDLRLYVRDAGNAIRRHLGALRRALGLQARRHAGAIMPGFTHLQPAQPVLAHHLPPTSRCSRATRTGSTTACAAPTAAAGSGALAGTIPDRSRLRRPAARFRGGQREQPRRGERPRLHRRAARGAGDPRHAPQPLRR
jgi:argininosuccinate lyase